MTIASNSVKITSRSGPADVIGTSFVCTAAAEGTFADLRTVLLEDEIVQAGDKTVFLLPDGEVVGKSSEAHLKWKTALKGGEVTITRLAHPIDDTNSTPESMSTLLRLSDELTRRERLFLVRRSKLGEGINIRDDRRPQYTGRAVVADVDPGVIRIMEREQTTEEVIVSYSERAATYARAGWAVRALDTTSPWVTSIIAASSGPEVTSAASVSAVWVTGRHLHGGCQVTLPGAHTLQPHPELRAAVEKALSFENLEQQRERLAEVWDRYGHVYADSVEMGGMCHATAWVKPSEQKSKVALERTMRHALDKKFGEQNLPVDLFDLEKFTVVGGSPLEQNVNKWMASLNNVATWSVTRTIKVVPLIDLFDEPTRMRIVAATPTHVPAPRAPASYPLFYTGVFATPYRSGRQVEFGTISFAHPFQIPPRVLVGINGLDFERDQMVRIKGYAPTITTDRARLEVITYDDTIQVASQFSWLAISAADDDIQCGTFESFEAYASGGFQTKIQFNRPYDAPPKVVVWLHHIAADSKIHEIRVKAFASDVARDGFDIHVETWDDSVLWYAGVSWLAHSAARTDIASGSYSTWNVHPPQFNDAQKTTSGHVSFGTSLRHAPRSVFVALSALNVSKHHNTRLSPLKTSNVTETGMDWEISTWDDSDLYFADAAFVAF